MKPGDLVFVHGKGFIAWAIRVAQWLPWRVGSQWNHVAVLDEELAGDWTVIQAEARGVTRGGTLSSLAPCVLDYEVVPLPPGVDAEKVLAFARAQVGRKYGYVTIASILVTLLTPRFFNVLWPNTWICSALAAESVRFGGWLHNWPDIYQISPAELFMALSEPATKARAS